MATPTLRQLRTFLAAVEAGSISKAARMLNLTQPAASQQLRELERAVGVRLLDRARGRLMPTAAGDGILGPARRAQAAAEDVVAAAGRHRAGEVGRVRLGTGATACTYLLPPVLAAVKRRMPGLEIAIATGNTPEMLERVEAGSLDVAFVTLPVSLSRALIKTSLLSDPLIALLPEAMAPVGPTIAPSQMTSVPLILYEAGGNTRAVVDGWFRRAGQAARPIMDLGSVEAIKVLVSIGLGASILPALALHDAVPGTAARRLRPAIARDLGLRSAPREGHGPRPARAGRGTCQGRIGIVRAPRSPPRRHRAWGGGGVGIGVGEGGTSTGGGEGEGGVGIGSDMTRGSAAWPSLSNARTAAKMREPARATGPGHGTGPCWGPVRRVREEMWIRRSWTS